MDDLDWLKSMARKYVWWKTPDEAVAWPERVMAQVMNIGDFDDMTALVGIAGEDRLRQILHQATAGEFNPRSWHYWHYRLGLAEAGQVPDMPERRFA